MEVLLTITVLPDSRLGLYRRYRESGCVPPRRLFRHGLRELENEPKVFVCARRHELQRDGADGPSSWLACTQAPTSGLRTRRSDRGRDRCLEPLGVPIRVVHGSGHETRASRIGDDVTGRGEYVFLAAHCVVVESSGPDRAVAFTSFSASGGRAPSVV